MVKKNLEESCTKKYRDINSPKFPRCDFLSSQQYYLSIVDESCHCYVVSSSICPYVYIWYGPEYEVILEHVYFSKRRDLPSNRIGHLPILGIVMGSPVGEQIEDLGNAGVSQTL